MGCALHTPSAAAGLRPFATAGARRAHGYRGLRAFAPLSMAHSDRRRQGHSNDPAAPFFVTRTGTAVTRRMAERAFVRLRAIADIAREDGARYQPPRVRHL